MLFGPVLGLPLGELSSVFVGVRKTLVDGADEPMGLTPSRSAK